MDDDFCCCRQAVEGKVDGEGEREKISTNCCYSCDVACCCLLMSCWCLGQKVMALQFCLRCLSCFFDKVVANYFRFSQFPDSTSSPLSLKRSQPFTKGRERERCDVTHSEQNTFAMCVIWNGFPFSLDHQETKWQWEEHDLFYTCPPPLFLSHRWTKIQEDTITEKDSLMQIKKDTLRTQMYISRIR